MKAKALFAQIVKDKTIQGFMWVDHEVSTAEAFSYLQLWSQSSLEELFSSLYYFSTVVGETIQEMECLPVSEVNFDTQTVSNACCQFKEFHSFSMNELKNMKMLNVERMELEDIPFGNISEACKAIVETWPRQFRIPDNYVVQKCE